ncbi:MAG: cyclase family protein, partial [Acidobacteria bacterium]|nr:cyclase family protein [Acidobacteriota bacterium]
MGRIFAVVTTLLVFAGGAGASAQTWRPPADSQRCPSKWGAGDERGAANHMKPETVLRATRLIRTGQVFELGRRLEASMPLQTTRTFEMHTKRTSPYAGSNRRGSNEEIVVAEIGQVGTQFDGFAHQTFGDSLYNCFKLEEIATRDGFTKLGIENIGALVTRGVLLDVAALKGVEMLPDTYEITVADLQQALQRQKLTLQPGDAVIIHTGWGKLWGRDNRRYMNATPGLSVAGV